MIINFDEIPLKRIQNFNGGEGEVLSHMQIDEMGKLARLTLQPGASIGVHTHTTSAEVMYFLEGHGTMLEEGADLAHGTPVAAGMCCYCPKGGTHSLVNTSDAPLTVLAVVPELGE